VSKKTLLLVQSLQLEIDRLTRELAERDADPSYSIACQTIRNLKSELAEAKARALPDGFVAMPVEPTPEIIAAMEQQWLCGSSVDMARREYRAAVSARPDPKESHHE
jgi:hypothetical protein